MSGKRRATKAKTRAPVAGLTAAHADMLVFLSQPHGALFDMAMQYAENAGIKRDLLAYIGISLAAVYLIFGSAARLFCNLIGFGYPMYASAKVIRTKATEDLNMWLIYWTCFAVLLLVDFFSETIFSFFPMYYMFKALFLAYLFLPQTRGTACLYDLLPVYDALGAYASPPRLSTGSDAHHTMEQQTGWSNLPAEMMCEVIKYLDPKSRAQLRATARLENEVVDSNKRKVEVLMVDAYQNGMLVWVDHERFDGSNEEMTYLVISILKTTKVKMLQLFAPRVPTDYWTGFLEKITDGGDLKCPIINMNHFEDLDFELFVKMCAPGTELFHLFRSPEEAFKKVLQDDATKGVMLGASVIQFATMDEDFSRTNDVVEAWIRNDQTIGKKMICWLGSFNDENDWLSDDYETELQPREDRILADFKKMFCDRVVEDKAKSVRIRMEDETKHIVVRMVQEDEGRFTEVYAVWEVIRADMSEDQYEKRSGHLHIEC